MSPTSTTCIFLTLINTYFSQQFAPKITENNIGLFCVFFRYFSGELECVVVYYVIYYINVYCSSSKQRH